MKKYRFVCLLLAALLSLLPLTGCTPAGKESDKISVVCTIFPEYDWVSQVIGEHADSFDIALLTDNGTDMHSYQVSVSDIALVSSCDIFIYVGGESDEWVEDILAGAVNKDIKAINLLDVLGNKVKEEEIAEGMKGEKEPVFGEADDESEEGPEYDEHVWLSISNAKVCVQAIAEVVAEADPDNSDYYMDSAASYIEKLEALNSEYQKVVDNASGRTLLFADRFPFRYLTDEYGLNYYAAFSGCSAETEASFSTVTFLAEKVDECGLGVVLILEGSDTKLAETVADSTSQGGENIKILTIDSLQSSTRSEIEAGKSYIGVMKSNLEILKAALN